MVIFTITLNDLVTILSLIVTIVGVIRSKSPQNNSPLIHMIIIS